MVFMISLIFMISQDSRAFSCHEVEVTAPWQSGRPRGRDPCTEGRERDTFIILDGVRKVYSTRPVGRHFNPPVAPWDPQMDPGEYSWHQ